jgi:citrate lyase beta subunit
MTPAPKHLHPHPRPLAAGGAFTVDGRRVDPPVLKLAQQCLAMAKPTGAP